MRAQLLKIASTLPKGDKTRREILAALARDKVAMPLLKGDLTVEFPLDRHDAYEKAARAVEQKSGGLIDVYQYSYSDAYAMRFRLNKDAIDRLVGRRTDLLK